MPIYWSQLSLTLGGKYPYSDFFGFVFSRTQIEYGEIPYSVQMRENMNQKNSEYGHFSRSVMINGNCDP